MQNGSVPERESVDIRQNDPLYAVAEEAANRFSLRVLSVLAFFAIVTEALNDIGLFKVDHVVMRPTIAVAFLLFILPVALWFFHDKVRACERPYIRRNFFRVLVIVVTFLGIGLICVALSFHAVIMMVIPPLLAAQYRNRRRLFFWMLTASVLLVPISVYGAFFLGAPDRNMLKTVETAGLDFAARLELGTPQRMWELFLHYVMPRLLCILAVVALSIGINRRNVGMLDKQSELTEKIKTEMEQRDRLQSRVIEALATLIETRDIGTGEHVARTRTYVTMLARAMKEDDRFSDRLTEEDIEHISGAAPLHDVGKIAVSDTILLKPGKLTPEEYDAMKVHTTKGGDMIDTLFEGMEDEQFLKVAEEIAVSHHEKWNGQGYPRGLRGEEIPLAARIMAVADVYDALVSVRVYKPAIDPEEALDIMFAESGTHFDPAIMDVVRRIRRDLIAAARTPLSHHGA